MECGGWLGVYVCTGENGGCLDSAWVFNCAEVKGGRKEGRIFDRLKMRRKRV